MLQYRAFQKGKRLCHRHGGDDELLRRKERRWFSEMEEGLYLLI